MADKTQAQIELGQKAKNLLDNELLNKWWQQAEKNLFEQFKKVSITDRDALLELKALVDAQQSMKNDFTRYVAMGNAAKAKVQNPAGKAWIASQYPLSKKEAIADIIIDNSSTLHNLKITVENTWKNI